MRSTKRVIIWLTIVLLAFVILLSLSFNKKINSIELLLLCLFCALSHSRAFLVDKILRQLRNQEIVPFSLFLFEIPLIRLFSLLILVRPFYTVTQNEVTEETRKKINILTYLIYSLLFALIIFNIIK